MKNDNIIKFLFLFLKIATFFLINIFNINSKFFICFFIFKAFSFSL